MKSFNAKSFESSHVFVCEACSASQTFNRVANGCPRCGYHLFRVANRGTGFPQIWDRDGHEKKKRRGPFSNTDGEGYDLTRPADEEWEGSGLGGRARGKGFPAEEAGGSKKHEYDEQTKDDVPGSLDDGEIGIPGDISAERSYKIPGEFTDPVDPLSSVQQMNRDMGENRRFDRMPLDNQLGRARSRKSVPSRKTDTVYERVSKQQRGVRL